MTAESSKSSMFDDFDYIKDLIRRVDGGYQLGSQELASAIDTLDKMIGDAELRGETLLGSSGDQQASALRSIRASLRYKFDPTYRAQIDLSEDLL